MKFDKFLETLSIYSRSYIKERVLGGALKDIVMHGLIIGVLFSLIIPFGTDSNVNAATDGDFYEATLNESFIPSVDSKLLVPTTNIADSDFDEMDSEFVSDDEDNSFMEISEKGDVKKIVNFSMEVKKGDTLSNILNKAGINSSVSNKIANAFNKVYSLRRIRIGDKFSVAIYVNKFDNEFLELESLIYEPEKGIRYVVKADSEKEYVALEEKDEFDTYIARAEGTINGSFLGSALDAGIPRSVIAEYIKLYEMTIDFSSDIQKGDKFEILYEKIMAEDGEMVKTGDILFASLNTRKTAMDLYRYDDGKFVDYYDEKGRSARKSLSKKPLNVRARISSSFGWRRHPVLKRSIMHWGVDYAVSKGTPVYAGGDGVIVARQWKGSYGKYIRIKHNSEYQTAYAHLNGWAKGVSVGKRVKKGDLIAYVGSTGRSTGPHLHYEVVKNGKKINPRTISVATGKTLTDNQLSKFKKEYKDIQLAYNKLKEKNLAQADIKNIMPVAVAKK